MNHDQRLAVVQDLTVSEEPPRDDYFIAQPGAVYVEVCDRCRRPNENPHCKICGGAYYTRSPRGETIHGRN